DRVHEGSPADEGSSPGRLGILRAVGGPGAGPGRGRGRPDGRRFEPLPVRERPRERRADDVAGRAQVWGHGGVRVPLCARGTAAAQPSGDRQQPVVAGGLSVGRRGGTTPPRSESNGRGKSHGMAGGGYQVTIRCDAAATTLSPTRKRG